MEIQVTDSLLLTSENPYSEDFNVLISKRATPNRGQWFHFKHEAFFFLSQHCDLGSDIWDMYSILSFW